MDYKECVKSLKRMYEEIGPTDWAKVCEEIEKLTSLFDDCISTEYNTDTSAQLHRNMDEDIVRHSSEEETGEAEDKEPQI